MADLLLLTATAGSSATVLPALGLLNHHIRVLPMEPSALVEAPDADVVLLDARRDLVAARTTCRILRATGLTVPLILIMTEGGLMVVNTDWGADDLMLDTAPPAEVEARIRLARENDAGASAESQPEEIATGDLVIDASGYTVRLRGRPLDLTYKEFELLKYLVQHPGRVFTRAQLLQEVWGYDYYGGTRTVDVHVRRLRAKLGPEYDQLISTVRNVGYRFDPPKNRSVSADTLPDDALVDESPAAAAGSGAGGADSAGPDSRGADSADPDSDLSTAAPDAVAAGGRATGSVSATEES